MRFEIVHEQTIHLWYIMDHHNLLFQIHSVTQTGNFYVAIQSIRIQIRIVTSKSDGGLSDVGTGFGAIVTETFFNTNQSYNMVLSILISIIRLSDCIK